MPKATIDSPRTYIASIHLKKHRPLHRHYTGSSGPICYESEARSTDQRDRSAGVYPGQHRLFHQCLLNEIVRQKFFKEKSQV